MNTFNCACGECESVRAAGGTPLHVFNPIALGSKDQVVAEVLACETQIDALAALQGDLHTARNELTRARLAADLIAQRLGVARTAEGDTDYEGILAAVDEIRERCGETEPQGDRHGG